MSKKIKRNSLKLIWAKITWNLRKRAELIFKKRKTEVEETSYQKFRRLIDKDIDKLADAQLDTLIEGIQLNVDIRKHLDPNINWFTMYESQIEEYLITRDPYHVFTPFDFYQGGAKPLPHQNINIKDFSNPSYSKLRNNLIIKVMISDKKYEGLKINDFIDLYIPDFDKKLNEYSKDHTEEETLNLVKRMVEYIYYYKSDELNNENICKPDDFKNISCFLDHQFFDDQTKTNEKSLLKITDIDLLIARYRHSIIDKFKPYAYNDSYNHYIGKYLKVIDKTFKNKDRSFYTEKEIINDIDLIDNIITYGLSNKEKYNPERRIDLIAKIMLSDQKYLGIDIHSYIDIYLPNFDKNLDEYLKTHSEEDTLNIIRLIFEAIYYGLDVEAIYDGNLSNFKESTLIRGKVERERTEKILILKEYVIKLNEEDIRKKY